MKLIVSYLSLFIFFVASSTNYQDKKWKAGINPNDFNSVNAFNSIELFSKGTHKTLVLSDEGTINNTISISQKIGRGINLGNTFSAPKEGNWSPVVHEQYFVDVANAGFSNVRLPIDFFGDRTTGSTHQYSTESNTATNYNGSISDYVVDSNYLDRIEEVIGWSLKHGLITIIDFHGNKLKDEFIHTFDSKEDAYTEPTSAKRLADREKFRAIWIAISNRFKNYSENLLFEIINEPYFDISKEEMDAINSDIIEVIRNSGGENKTRKIIITGGGKNSYEAPLQIDPQIVSNDENIIATFHYYWPREFTASSEEKHNQYTWGTANEKSEIDKHFTAVKNWGNTYNTPIYLGEFGADNEGGYNYFKGTYGEFGGPENESRALFHRYLADKAIELGFAFAAWDAGNKANKTIHKRTDNPETVNLNADGSVNTNTWVENVKNALLGIDLVKDDDNDGVPNDEDLCVNTENGIEVDAFGCPIVTISNNNFEISSIDETCASSNNGHINISAIQNLNYTATLTGDKTNKIVDFNQEKNFSNLSSGVYNLCITVTEIPFFEQCYNIEIKEPEVLKVSSKINNSKKTIDLNLSGGTIYKINLNGSLFTTTNNIISLPLNQQINHLEVTTDIACQGIFQEQIFKIKNISIYPNPTTDIINIQTDETLKELSLFNQIGQEINLGIKHSSDNNVQLNLINLPKGVYFIRVNGFTESIIKK